ncbi:MAG TPA: gamma-glutamyltransferase [Thermoanaerobaculaceae bacterium]|nr:gamma-glutamyltransferase [Thermoanaerobaculaceae bacterium]
MNLVRAWAVVSAVAVTVCVPPTVNGQRSGRRSREATNEPPVARAYAESPSQLIPTEVVSRSGMVVSGSGEASRAGAAILEAGGNAVDAAVATALALGVAEPTTSGLGGEALLLIYMRDGRATAIDGSCYVPFLARPDELQRERSATRNGVIHGYKAVAVPGVLAALGYALERYGTKRLDEVLAGAIEIADYGYRMNLTELGNVENYGTKLRQQNRVAEMFLKDYWATFEPEHVYCPSDLAQTLRRIAALGTREFYRGEIADAIEADMQRNGGYVRKADLVQVRAVERRPHRGSYRGYEVVAFPFPGGGGSLLEMLNILETFPSELLRKPSLDRLHLLIESSRIVNTDAGTPQVPLPLLDQQIADKRRAAERAKLIRFDRALLAGEISREAPDPYLAVGTTQVSVVDQWGNIASLTQTVGASFGAGIATPGLGFMWNSNLNAFEFQNRTNAHYVMPGQPAMTAMTPAVVLKDGRPLLVLGSAGSDRVVPTIVSVITGVVDRGLSACEAVAAPRAVWGSNYGPLRPWVELAGEITPDKATALEAQGFADMFELKFPARWTDLMLFGGTNTISLDPETGEAVGVGDPRRLGVAVAPSMTSPALRR